MTDQVLTVLKRARDLIADESHWTTRFEARDKHGSAIGANRDQAICFCAVGALVRARSMTDTRTVVFMADLIDAMHKAIPTNDSIPVYNDTHTHAEVLAVFDEAIRIREAS
jgi:hypothetical protein